MNTTGYKFLIADDHRIILDGIRILLERDFKGACVHAVETGREAVECALESNPDFLIMDQAMPELNGIEATRRLRAAGFAGRIVMLSSHREPHLVREAKLAGVDAYILKEYAFERIVDAVKAIGQNNLSPEWLGASTEALQNEPRRPIEQLTKREKEVLKLLAAGENAKSIAMRLGVSPKTVEAHRVNLIKKMKVSNLASLTRIAIREGLAYV